MATPQELFDTVLAAVRRVQAARQALLETRATLKLAEDEFTAAEAALTQARADADQAIDVATGKRV